VADLHLAQRDWTKLRGSKLFLCPQIADAYYHELLTKAELEDVGRRAENPKHRVTSRVSSEVCDLVPVKHEKAEAALAAFRSIVNSKQLNISSSTLTPESIVGSLLRPIRVWSQDTVNLFDATTVETPLLETLTGLTSKTLRNIRKKGRINAYSAAAIARTSLSAALLESLSKDQLEGFPDHSPIKRVFEGRPVYVNGVNLAVDRNARHKLFDRFLAHCRKASLVDEENEKLKLARRNLRDFFTTDYQAFSSVVMKAGDDSYLVDSIDQIPAPSDWRNWS
jgi:hypothetical protein